ncbi:centrosomal protein of 192 kDa [Ctenodactylus gundi]
MEDFRGIAEESFPSFLTSSLLGNGGTLDDVTLSSNLGLPIAVSTLAKSRLSTGDRCPDVQASYLVEERFTVPLESPPSCHSDTEPRERLRLSFQDEDCRLFSASPHMQWQGQPMRQPPVWPRRLQTEYPWSQHQNGSDTVPFQNRSCLGYLLVRLSCLEAGAAGCYEFPRSRLLADLGLRLPAAHCCSGLFADSSVDFCLRSWLNNQEYKITVPDAGKQFEDKISASDFSHTSLLENEKLMSLTSLEDSSDDDINDEEFYDDHLEAYFEQLAIPGMIYEDLEGQESPEKEFKLPVMCPNQVNESNLDCKCQSEDNSSQISHGTHSSESSETAHKESEEGCVFYLCGTGTDRPQSVVYQNEEGRWVTDLAYYTSFNSEQDLNMSLNNEMNEDFRSGSEALDMIAKDEEEFNKENQFIIQEENTDAQSTSVAIGDTSWVATVNYNLLRKSLSTSDLDTDDASYLRLSLGEFFARRSEALGCLDGGNNVKRPSFGYFIKSPEKTEPVALIRESDVSRSDLEKEMAHRNHNMFSGELNEQSQGQVSEGSVTLQVEALAISSQVDESDVPLTDEKGKTEDTFFRSDNFQKCGDELPDSGASVLRISTIASAIADASVSTDPSQLAAMMKTLKNRTRGWAFQEEENPSDRSTVSCCLPSDLEKSNGSSAFDMEKYLTKTDVSRYAGELENFSRAAISAIWNLSLLKEHTVRDSHPVDSSATDVNVREPKENATAVSYSEIGESENQESCRTTDSSNLILTNIRQNESAVLGGKRSPVDPKLQGAGNKEEEIQSARENQRHKERVSETSSSNRRVTLEKCSIIPPDNVDLMTLCSERGGSGSEEDQESFRPSTSPVSHSSPSEASGATFSGGALESLDVAACPPQPRSENEWSGPVCSAAERSRLTYVSEQESPCSTTTSGNDLEDRKIGVTSELSTTIIRASAAPSEEQAVERLREKVPGQNTGAGALPPTVLDRSDVDRVTAAVPRSGPDDVDPTLTLSQGASPESRRLFKTSEPAPHPLAFPSKAGLSCQAWTVSPPLPELCHKSVDGEHAQSSVAVGLCLGPSLTSGLLGPAPFCTPCSSAFHQNLQNAAKSFPVQPVGAPCGIEPWKSEMTAGFGSVRVPEELKLPHTCCVGIASQTCLSVFNPTDRWLQVSLSVLSLSVNGEKVDLSTYPCLVFKNKVIIRPHATEEIKVLFIPSSPGIFRCIFSVASWPFSADAETVVQAEALASRVVLTAVAESPMIEVETEGKGVLDFGDLTYGGWKALPLKLINRSHAAVPIRLTINANALAWRCFTFSKDPVQASLATAPYANVLAQLAAPSVVSHVMPASYEGQDPEFLIIWVLFHSPKKLVTSSEVLDSAEEFLARVDLEVDSPNPAPVLSSVRLHARAGFARIHAPRDLQTVHLLSSVNSSVKQYLPLKNAGNIEVYLDIKVPEAGSHFSVYPDSLFLKPGEEHEVKVSYAPKDPRACEERILRIFVRPCGPQYEVMLKGEVVSSGSEPLPPRPRSPDIPSILSNRQFLTWGGVPLGRTQLQKLALRSSCTSTTQNLRLLIRGQDQDCFQLQNMFGSEERLTSSCEIRIHPKEDVTISVLFAPTRLSCMLAKLEIKQLGNRLQPGIKFMIPLSGYGGTSNLILEGVKKLSDSYMVTVNGLTPGKESRVVFSVRNTGSRAAFVKAVGFKDSQKKVLLDPKVLRIFPDKFVLKERTQEDITLIYNPSDRKNDCKTTTELSTVYFFGGDEISRQQYRRALSHHPGATRQVLPEHSVLRSIDFAEVFQDERLVDEVYDLPQRPNDIQLFYGNMRKVILSVIGEFRDFTSSPEFLQPSSKASLESKGFPGDSGTSGKHSSNVSLDVLPVRGPQGSPFPSRTTSVHHGAVASEELWTIQPEHVILVAPSAYDMAKTGRFHIINNSAWPLKFELYWPAHCLTVTPQHGFVAPESKEQILVSPNSSLSTKQSVFPWSGLIYIHSDKGQKKIVKVQIREDLTQEKLLPHLASNKFGILSLTSEPSVSHLAKPMKKPPSTEVRIRNKTVTFPTAEPGKASESCLELENLGPADVRWHLSSFAPPYVKGVDETGDVFRATYAAFMCCPISGTLEGHGTQKVSITFLPRDKGDYAQFWDVECHPVKEPHLKHTLRFQLSGQSVRREHAPGDIRACTGSLVKIDAPAAPRRRTESESEASVVGPGLLDLSHRGVYAPKDAYTFLPTRVGESRMLKVSLRNSSFITHLLKFLSPREPFYIKHSKYSLRARHYIHIPVHFRPQAGGRFEALLVVQTDEGNSIAVRLIGEALQNTSYVFIAVTKYPASTV